MTHILILNAGSSSLKYKVFQYTDDHLTIQLSGLMEQIGEPLGRWTHINHTTTKKECAIASHQAALMLLSDILKHELGEEHILGVGHRVVHGGNHYTHSTLITPQVLATIKSLAPLAPLHNPVNAEGIEFARTQFSEAMHVAIFDTSFHQTMPLKAKTYAINADIAKQYQIRRYGFHGINHQYVAEIAASHLKKPLNQCHFISLHLGNGASATLIKNGQSFDTTMGLTPLPGLMMGTRCGDIDPSIIFYLQRLGLSLEEVDTMLNKKSGLLGIGGYNDMRQLYQQREMNNENARLAIEMYVYQLQKTIGAYLSQIPSLDALIFTGGVGENAAFIRQETLTSLAHLGLNLDDAKNNDTSIVTCRDIASTTPAILVIRGDEELKMAEEVVKIVKRH